MKLFIIFFACCFITASAQAEWHTENATIMGTNIHVEVWAEQPELGTHAIQTVFTEMQRINQLMSPYIDSSELSKINRLAAHQPVKISQEMFDLLQLSVGLSAETQGAFDITFASVGFLYHYQKKHKPTQQDIDKALSAISYKHIQLDPANTSVYFNHTDVKIDLGGIAKGHVVDTSIELLKNLGIQHALVTAGGDTKLLGDRLGRPWHVGIRDPRNKERQAVTLPLINTAISTSGDYERYFEQDGVRYHHILSPKTGKSAYQVQSVSIIGKRSTLNDGLSTAVFVLGVKDGIDLINRTPGYDAIIMDNQRKMHYSKDLVL
ncbi:FAD:protein FMN transferase [Paraglaciecola sp. L3A3]|uniref:FAD:protein FMN transferase n=1 Tax=Paraglaciecola sp. L3A3 TaxID=2686358 RepID=UPI00131D7663|nr:FAD:protein FMN transferase [Paraglaciecola sp. L3A3]